MKVYHSKFSDAEYPAFTTKAKALRFLKEKGYTEHYSTTESGDHGYGSREYFKNAAGELASASKVEREWLVSFLG